GRDRRRARPAGGRPGAVRRRHHPHPDLPGGEHLSSATPPPPAGGQRPDDPVRRLAIVALAILVVLVGGLAVAIKVTGGGSPSGPVADVSGATTAQRSPAGVLPVEAPVPDPAADAPC